MTSEVSSNDNGVSDNEKMTLSAEELEKLYLLLESSIPELQWQNPGRILEEDSKIEKNSIVETSETQEPAKNDFDFSDDIAQPAGMRVRNQTPKSAKKKTANFADVVKRIKNPASMNS